MQNNDEQHEQDLTIPPPNQSNEYSSHNGQAGDSLSLASIRSEFSEKVVTLFNEIGGFAVILSSYRGRKKLNTQDLDQNRAHIIKLYSLNNELTIFINQNSILLDEQSEIIPVIEEVSYNFSELISIIYDYCIKKNCISHNKESSESDFKLDDFGEPLCLINNLIYDEKQFPALLALIGDQTKKYLISFKVLLMKHENFIYDGLIDYTSEPSRKRKNSYDTEYYKEQILTVLKEAGRSMTLVAIYIKIKVDPDAPDRIKPPKRIISDYITTLIIDDKVESVLKKGRNGYEVSEKGRTYRLKL